MTAVRVVKIGGSLLNWDELDFALQRWFGSRPAVSSLVVVGGGQAVDSLRTECQQGTMDNVTAHWEAIYTMDRHTQTLFDRMRGQLGHTCTLESQLPVAQLRLNTPNAIVFFQCASFLRSDDAAHSNGPLPCDWSVTSDSIAARLAETFHANLVLLKSTTPPDEPWREWARHGFVDAFFPVAAQELNIVEAVNLRKW